MDKLGSSTNRTLQNVCKRQLNIMSACETSDILSLNGADMNHDSDVDCEKGPTLNEVAACHDVDGEEIEDTSKINLHNFTSVTDTVQIIHILNQPKKEDKQCAKQNSDHFETTSLFDVTEEQLRYQFQISKYSWPQSAWHDIIPVISSSTNGLLHKKNLGSGARGKCIQLPVDSESLWMTPQEFESFSNRASSKNTSTSWRNSILYSTTHSPLSRLIEDGLLLIHAVSCTCTACSTDTECQGNIRLQIPASRRGNLRSTVVSLSKPLLTACYPPKNCRQSPPKRQCGSASNNSKRKKSATSMNLISEPEASVDPQIVYIVLADGSGNVVASEQVGFFMPKPRFPAAQDSVLCNIQDDTKAWKTVSNEVLNLKKHIEAMQQTVAELQTRSSLARNEAFIKLRMSVESEKERKLASIRSDTQQKVSLALAAQMVKRKQWLSIQKEVIKKEVMDELQNSVFSSNCE